MRKRVWAVAAVVACVAAGTAGWLWLRAEPGEGSASPLAPEVPAFQALPVQAAPAAGQQSLTLTGVVKDAGGRPVPGARVFLAASAQPGLATHRCAHCTEPLLACRARESWPTVAAFVAGGGAGLPAGAETVSGDEGAFRFEHLVGVSFTVWATKEGLGLGLRERAAPGEPVELYLPDVRTLSGRLRDERGQPVRGTVHALPHRLPLGTHVDSDAAGHFTFGGLGEGPFYLLAEAPGLLPAARAQVAAAPGQVELVLATPRRLEVTLTRGGQPVDGEVQLRGDHLVRASATAKGVAAFERLYPGRVVVTGRAGSLSSSPQVVSLDGPLTRVTVALDPGGIIRASAVDEAGAPVPDPAFEVLTVGGEAVARATARTGEVASVGPLGQGEYQLRARAAGYQEATLPVRLGASEVGVEVVLQKGTAICGRVLDEYGRAAAGVSVLISPIGDSVFADAEGRFVAPVPSPGLYELHAHHSDWGGGQKKVTAPADGVELQLEPRAGAEVTVVADGRRVEGATAVLFVDREGSFRSDRPSGADGVVLMRGLPAGAYTLIVSHPDYLQSERQKVVLEDGRLLKVQAELRTGAEVKGQVVDELGAPVPGVAVGVMPRGAEPVLSDPQGEFVLRPLRKDVRYLVRVQQRGYDQPERVIAVAGGPPVKVTVRRQPIFRGRVVADGRPVKIFRVDDHLVESADGRFELPLPAVDDRVIFAVTAAGYEPLMVDRPASPDLGDLALDAAPQLTGLVRDEAGSPVADAVVGCDVCEQSVLTSADGRFSLGQPAFVKEYVVVARKGRRTATRTVGKGAGHIELVLSPGVHVRGSVWLPDGRPGAGVELQAVHTEQSDQATVVTASDGTYQAELAPGAWRFSLATVGEGFHGAGPAQVVWVANLSGPEARLDFGPAPGTSSLSVRLKPERGWGLWLIRGSLASLEGPPLELLKSGWAQLVFQPTSERVTFQGLTPGPYTIVWGSLHAPAAPTLVRVDVPSQPEVTLVR